MRACSGRSSAHAPVQPAARRMHARHPHAAPILARASLPPTLCSPLQLRQLRRVLGPQVARRALLVGPLLVLLDFAVHLADQLLQVPHELALVPAGRCDVGQWAPGPKPGARGVPAPPPARTACARPPALLARTSPARAGPPCHTLPLSVPSLCGHHGTRTRRGLRAGRAGRCVVRACACACAHGLRTGARSWLAAPHSSTRPCGGSSPTHARTRARPCALARLPPPRPPPHACCALPPAPPTQVALGVLEQLAGAQAANLVLAHVGVVPADRLGAALGQGHVAVLAHQLVQHGPHGVHGGAGPARPGPGGCVLCLEAGPRRSCCL